MPYLNKSGGQGLVEYILIVVLMAILAISAIKVLGSKTQDAFKYAGNQLSQQLQGT